MREGDGPHQPIHLFGGQGLRLEQQDGQELGVDYLLTGTVRRTTDASGTARVQVIPELVDTRTGSASWQSTYNETLTDVIAVQGDIASQVATALGIALGAGEKVELSARPTENVAAFDAFLRGDDIFRQALALAADEQQRRTRKWCVR